MNLLMPQLGDQSKKTEERQPSLFRPMTARTGAYFGSAPTQFVNKFQYSLAEQVRNLTLQWPRR